MKLAELILSISRPIGKLGNRFTNVVFRPYQRGFPPPISPMFRC